MSKILFFAGLFGYASVAFSWSSDNTEQVFSDYYRSYFDSLKLQYEVPRGCSANTADGSTYDGTTDVPNCALAADFNGDGSPDYAALLEFIGAGHRYANSYIDLIVLYSSDYQGEVQHAVFTHMGGVTERGDIDIFLKLQPIGEINLPSGIKKLDRPGINLLSIKGGNDNPWLYPTIYWNDQGQNFYSISKHDD